MSSEVPQRSRAYHCGNSTPTSFTLTRSVPVIYNGYKQDSGILTVYRPPNPATEFRPGPFTPLNRRLVPLECIHHVLPFSLAVPRISRASYCRHRRPTSCPLTRSFPVLCRDTSRLAGIRPFPLLKRLDCEPTVLTNSSNFEDTKILPLEENSGHTTHKLHDIFIPSPWYHPPALTSRDRRKLTPRSDLIKWSLRSTGPVSAVVQTQECFVSHLSPDLEPS